MEQKSEASLRRVTLDAVPVPSGSLRNLDVILAADETGEIQVRLSIKGNRFFVALKTEDIPAAIILRRDADVLENRLASAIADKGINSVSVLVQTIDGSGQVGTGAFWGESPDPISVGLHYQGAESRNSGQSDSQASGKRCKQSYQQERTSEIDDDPAIIRRGNGFIVI